MTLRRFAQTGALTIALTVTATGTAATKPWQWTTKQAQAAITAQGDDIYMDAGFIERDLDSVTCRGLSKAGPSRFVSFRCAAVFEESKVTLFAKTRRAGGMCWSTRLAAVPPPCLAAGVRKRGTSRSAKAALAAVVGPGLSRCLASGFGYYLCSWQSGETPMRGTVTFSPAPVVKLLS